MSDETLVQIVTLKITAALVVQDGRVVEAAPIFYWLMGKTIAEVKAACATQGWQVTAYRRKVNADLHRD